MKLVQEELGRSFEGVTVDFSREGAFIKTKGCHFFRVQDETNMICFLPPEFTGQDTTIGLRGPAVICRIDQEGEGIALEFVRMLKQFERVSSS